ncbi:MAG: histidine phosphatase family protein [Clostridiales bacterium]|nr:histidine phosphatase family protein [Clostridiales bacterium]
MTRLVVVRHAESEGNYSREFHGQYNSDITEKGHVQAECTAKFLDGVKIDKIYSSDIKRAYSTAKHVADRKGLEIIKDEGLREIFAGEWERKSFFALPEEYPELFEKWKTHKSQCTLPGGESVSHLAHRIINEFEKIARENEGKTVLVVTHATPIASLICLWKGKELSYMDDTPWAANASVSIVDYIKDGEYKIEMLAYSEHLEKEGLLTTLPKSV